MMISNEFTEEFKNKQSVKSKMTQILNDSSITKSRDEFNKKYKTFMIVLGCVFLAIFIAGLVFSIYNKFYIFIAFIFAFLALLYFFCGYIYKNSLKKQYANLMTPTVIETIYGPKAIYELNKGYARSYLEGLKIFPVNILEQRTFISGHFDDVPFTTADVTSYHWETRGSGKDRHREKVIDFMGSVMSFRLNKASKATIKVNEGMSLFSGKSIDFESVEFNKKFNVYCSDEENAFYIITPQLQLAMLDLEKYLPGGMTFLFRGNELVIAISGNTISFDKIDMKKDLNHNLNIILDVLLAPAFIIDKMNLDHNFFINKTDNSKENEKEDVVSQTVNKVVDALDQDSEEKIQKSLEEVTSTIDKKNE